GRGVEAIRNPRCGPGWNNERVHIAVISGRWHEGLAWGFTGENTLSSRLWGIPPPTPTWGNMMGGAVANVLISHWPLVVFPGLTITLVVLAFNFFGDAIRDVFDPKLRGSNSLTMRT